MIEKNQAHYNMPDLIPTLFTEIYHVGRSMIAPTDIHESSACNGDQ